MKEKAEVQVGSEFLEESERVRIAHLAIAKDQARRHLYFNEENMRKGREFSEMSPEEFQRFVDTVVELMFPNDEKLTDEQIIERGFKVDTVRGKARSTRGFLSQISNNQRLSGGPSPFMQRTGINRNREGIQ